VDIISISDFSKGLKDEEVVKVANRERRIIVTFDKDFGEIVVKRKLKVQGIIVLRLKPESPEKIADRLTYLLSSGIELQNSMIIMQQVRIRVIALKQ
jgi:predicted nuclease of predicted toxin-antitoxin system